MPDNYKLTIEEHATYVHAKGEGPRTPENALRFLREAHAACVKLGRSSLLLEMAFEGAAFDAGTIFSLVSERAPEGAKLTRIAYVEASPEQAPRASFAETIAVNRGVNVKLFPDVEAARKWLKEGVRR